MNVLRKYCSEFSLHTVKEDLRGGKARRRFDFGSRVMGEERLLDGHSLIERTEGARATDLRSFNGMAEMESDEKGLVRAMVVIMGKR